MVKVKIVSSDYSIKTGLTKTLKNMGITFGIPALLYFLSRANVWLPQEMIPVVAPIIGGISYVVKNYIENK